MTSIVTDEGRAEVLRNLPKHPVDALKALGMPMTPEQEAAMRAICDEEVCGCDCEDDKDGDA